MRWGLDDVQRLKTRSQFQAVLAGITVARTAHFALHRLMPEPTALVQAIAPPSAASEASKGGVAISAFQANSAWIGALVPKRWAKRAVTRNMIKRQIYTMTQIKKSTLQIAAHVVRLRAGFGKDQYPSATSMALKAAVHLELEQLFALAAPVASMQRPTQSNAMPAP